MRLAAVFLILVASITGNSAWAGLAAGWRRNGERPPSTPGEERRRRARGGPRAVRKGALVLPQRERLVGRLSTGGPGDPRPAPVHRPFGKDAKPGPADRPEVVLHRRACTSSSTACWSTSLDFPLAYYAGYVRQHAYGLSNQTFAKWLADSLKELAVGHGLRLPAAVAALPADPPQSAPVVALHRSAGGSRDGLRDAHRARSGSLRCSIGSGR